MKICVLPGDGIGPEIMAEAVRVLKALDLKIEDFRSALKTPKALALGLFGHHVLFPAMTYVLVWILQPQPSIALGMILVSSCPAGHISNFLVHFSRGNTALSISMTAVSGYRIRICRRSPIPSSSGMCRSVRTRTAGRRASASG